VPAVPVLLPPVPGLSAPAAPEVLPPEEPADPGDVPPGPLCPHAAAKRKAPEHASNNFFTWSSQFRPFLRNISKTGSARTLTVSTSV
jgi:hypothetical protein